MQMKKTIGVLLAVCFLMSVTAAAVSAKPTDDHFSWFKTKAVDDKFKFDSKNNKGNVLDNDKGKDLKVVWFSDAKKGIVTMKKNGKFTYTPFKSKEKFIKDSFKYTIKGKDGKISSAKVTIVFENKKFDDHDNHGHR
jgi:hypothetical protein